MSLPDYLGLGDSPGRHLYCHSKTEATASIDLYVQQNIIRRKMFYTTINFLFSVIRKAGMRQWQPHAKYN